MKIGCHAGRRAIAEANGRGEGAVAISRPLAIANDAGASLGKVDDFEFRRAYDQLGSLADRKRDSKVVSILRHFAAELTMRVSERSCSPGRRPHQNPTFAGRIGKRKPGETALLD